MTDQIIPFPIDWPARVGRFGDWHRSLILYEDDKVTLKNVTNYNAYMYILSAYVNGKQYDLLSTANGRITKTGASGLFVFNITKAEVQAYQFSSAVLRIIYDDGAGNTTDFAKGTLEIV